MRVSMRSIWFSIPLAKRRRALMCSRRKSISCSMASFIRLGLPTALRAVSARPHGPFVGGVLDARQPPRQPGRGRRGERLDLLRPLARVLVAQVEAVLGQVRVGFDGDLDGAPETLLQRAVLVLQPPQDNPGQLGARIAVGKVDQSSDGLIRRLNVLLFGVHRYLPTLP